MKSKIYVCYQDIFEYTPFKSLKSVRYVYASKDFQSVLDVCFSKPRFNNYRVTEKKKYNQMRKQFNLSILK